MTLSETNPGRRFNSRTTQMIDIGWLREQMDPKKMNNIDFLSEMSQEYIHQVRISGPDFAPNFRTVAIVQYFEDPWVSLVTPALSGFPHPDHILIYRSNETTTRLKKTIRKTIINTRVNPVLDKCFPRQRSQLSEKIREKQLPLIQIRLGYAHNVFLNQDQDFIIDLFFPKGLMSPSAALMTVQNAVIEEKQQSENQGYRGVTLLPI